MRARKKPVEVDVWLVEKCGIDDIPAWITGNQITVVAFAMEKDQETVDHIIIRTLEGAMQAHIGDWIVKGVKGELYPVRPDIFDETFDLIPEKQTDTWDRGGAS